ncbi:hypothetical protein [Streptomyces olivochromogenes]|uniref:hypothetical protein n=1 Tax=Streptomyces olivochromogenes TaxID=1963 RepID=UPI001F3F0D5E|nr:hypothetical protein [Streptomyces olivochromogenes]MCF3130376.1 hypothetical protein [Streptomyces olivochromogenes]
MSAHSPAPGDMLEPVRHHLRHRDPAYDFDVGPGRRQLLLECHQAVVAEFPDHELRAAKQKFASLAFQGSPRPWIRFVLCDVRETLVPEHARL